MSIFSTLAHRIRTLLAQDKESKVLKNAQGYPSIGPGGYSDYSQSLGQDFLTDFLRLEYDLLSRFLDYEYMDEYPEIGTALDIYAADATQPDSPTGRRIWIKSEDQELEQLLNDFLHRQIRIEDQVLTDIARGTCSNGNWYGEITLGEEGVIQVRSLAPATMRRVEGARGELYGFIQDFQRRVGYTPDDYMSLRASQNAEGQTAAPSKLLGHRQAVTFESWQIVHFRVSSKSFKSVYGYAVTDHARWAWKRLLLLEDSALIYRIQRAPERFAFYVDVGKRPPEEAMHLLNLVRQDFKKKKFVNPKTNQIDLRFHAIAPDEDIFLPVVDGQTKTRVETLGSPSWQSVEDIEYFRTKLFAALKVPKAYLGQDEGAGRAVLSSEDVRFARTILTVQSEIRMGIEKICRVHLAALGIPPDRVDFNVMMTVPSAIFELAQAEVRAARADLASRLKETVSEHWILSNVMGLSDTEITQVFGEREADMERLAVGNAKAEKAASKFAPSEGGGMYASRKPPQNGRRLEESRSYGQRQPLSSQRSDDNDKGVRGRNASSSRREIELLLQSNRRLSELKGLLFDLKSRLAH